MRLLVLFFLFTLSLWSQELPPVINFDPSTYNAGNQNWMLTQSSNKFIHIANNLGLLSYNGEQWRLNKMPDGSAVRSVLSADEKVYTGSYMDFGYWERDNKGLLNYHSLMALSGEEIIDGEQFWHIEELEEYIVFQSLRRLFSYHKETQEINLITAENIISNLFKVDNKLYYQVAEDGLYVIKNGIIDQIVPNTAIQDKPIVGLFEFKENTLLAVTRDDGIFTIKNGSWQTFKRNNYPIEKSVFTAKLIQDNILVLGTIGNGLHLYNLQTLERTKLLQPVINNNTVLSIFEDEAGNIWCGLDNGLVLINRKSPFKLFTDIYGKVGTVYCSYSFKNRLYIGSNQGLYVTSPDKSEYELIAGTSGQVWSINEINGKLYAGHDRGTFEINKKSAKHIFDGQGVWEIEAFKKGLLQGHYDGISYWEGPKPKSDPVYLDNFDLSSRNVVIENDTTIWVGHDHKGIFKLKIDDAATSVLKKESFNPINASGQGLKVFQFNDSIHYSTKNGVYSYISAKNHFLKNKEFTSLLKERQLSGISEVLPDNTWWSFGGENLLYVTKDAFQERLSLKSVPLPIEYRSVAKGFENVSLIGEREYLVGSNIGYTIFSTPVNLPETPQLAIHQVATASLDKNFKNQNLDIELLELSNTTNNIRFDFSIPDYSKLVRPVYSYRIKGFNAGWNKSENNGTVNFENLPAGDYIFEVRGKYNTRLSNIASYAFSIAPAWYASITAIIVYVLLFLLLIFILHKIYTGYYRKQRSRLLERNRKKLEIKQLEARQEIITLQNQKLESDMASKNRELAASTMNLIKKNEFLNELKKKLTSAGSDDDIQKVISVINKNIAEKDNWKLFKEAFDNADKDFLQSVKEAHPKLTSNDLKLCAYLRLNLSSKEIAPLLNISVRSVEIKRYRLRKKIKLEHDQGLVEYILQF